MKKKSSALENHNSTSSYTPKVLRLNIVYVRKHDEAQNEVNESSGMLGRIPPTHSGFQPPGKRKKTGNTRKEILHFANACRLNEKLRFTFRAIIFLENVYVQIRYTYMAKSDTT